MDRCEVQVLGARNEARGTSRGAASGRLPLVHQRCANDCGPAALATVAACHGYALDYDDFADAVALDRGGTSLLALSRTAERLGFRTHGIRASYDAIADCTLPAIAHLRGRFGGGHFVVVHRWTEAAIALADPATGLRTMSRAAFRRRSTGYFLIIQPPSVPALE